MYFENCGAKLFFHAFTKKKNGHQISSPCSFNKQLKYYFSLVNCNYMMPFLANEKAFLEFLRKLMWVRDQKWKMYHLSFKFI